MVGPAETLDCFVGFASSPMTGNSLCPQEEENQPAPRDAVVGNRRESAGAKPLVLQPGLCNNPAEREGTHF